MIKLNKCLLACVLCVLYVFCAGCKTADNVEEISTEALIISEYVEKIQSSIDREYNKGYTKKELDYRFSNKCSGVTTGRSEEGYQYGRVILYLDGLITDERISSVSYSLGNCVGSFNDEYYLRDATSNSVKDAIVNLKSKSYVCDKDGQETVFFTVYYYYNLTSDYKMQAQEIQNCIKDLRITANITYDDGTEEIRLYGIEFPYETVTTPKGMRVVLFQQE